MKLVAIVGVVACLLAVSTPSWAGSCCGSKKSASMSCSDQFSSLSLTDEQKAKITELEAACKAEGSDKATCEKYKAEMLNVLNDEQREQYDAACQKMGKKGSCKPSSS